MVVLGRWNAIRTIIYATSGGLFWRYIGALAWGI
jgi:hypothetical protein